jgi:DNA adenine methylase
LKWHGGKSYLARWIVSLMAPHVDYVEPYAGGLAVLLARDPNDRRLWLADMSSTRGVSEVANHIDCRLVSFWRVLADPEWFSHFRRRVEAVPLSRPAWEEAHAYGTDPLADAVAFFVDNRQSLADQIKGFTALARYRTRRGINGNASEWLSAVDGLPAICERQRPVVQECRPALEVIKHRDGPGTLFYCDPP